MTAIAASRPRSESPVVETIGRGKLVAAGTVLAPAVALTVAGTLASGKVASLPKAIRFSAALLALPAIGAGVATAIRPDANAAATGAIGGAIGGAAAGAALGAIIAASDGIMGPKVGGLKVLGGAAIGAAVIAAIGTGVGAAGGGLTNWLEAATSR